jgi:hypothetical protein
MTLHVFESETLDHWMCRLHGGENVSIVGEAAFWNQVFQFLNAADSTGAINKQKKRAFDLDRVELSQLIQIQSNRSECSHFTTKGILTFVPPINGSRI